MKIYQVITVVFGVFLLSGCGDQFWCGEDGCSGKKIVRSSSSTEQMKFKNNSILKKFH
jgi:hypothetical protein